MPFYPIQVVQFSVDREDDDNFSSLPLRWAIHIPMLSRSSTSASPWSPTSSESAASGPTWELETRTGRTYYLLSDDSFAHPKSLSVRTHTGYDPPFDASSWRGTAVVGAVSSNKLAFLERILERVSPPTEPSSLPPYMHTSDASEGQIWVWDALAALRFRGLGIEPTLTRSVLQVEMVQLREAWEFGDI
ncbi:hypothetical protein CONPUDRAFT_163821 [Coniophora puteana RWD-64-598 SS2]|uniref:Uncharacterized protein n=1 Tax=Coniophora puteana (strain RWD-64-598) TaxID=741705 RepID=A0A5M3MU93_CONPW|nr:uncharacterized protein CONPUDRAFT_163821 [Coniophora puteana RWD-64-598 SS2]EIW82742.1 hypothetical protein CONPUDRAFT_163821 [Coniophora puteana RWD-64-598 SS2]